ncbi:protein kinase [Pseudomonas sp. FW305-3-2-15-A-LB2]|nr:protein kinase [Pseudomonas sp. FW305-3-2-15-C-TSA2]PMV39221.1 protein kinase [Pseudomonas sp. FW305-3-2-15-A-LB2]PMV63323.1 protein kinase [Pseudomonas sp. FW305-3-2-15-C-LB3]
MKHYYPDQKPSFLFDEMERSTHTAISIGAFHVLQAERDALQIQVNKLNALHQTLHEQFVAAVAERDSLLQRVDEESPLNERSQRGYECVLGAVLQVIFSRSPAGKRYSVFDSQDSLVSTIVAHSGELFGISKRSLDTKFAAARRRLKAP